MTSKPSLSDAIQLHLRTHGPTSAVDLHAALVAGGVTTTKTPSGVRSSLSGSRFAFQLPDERWDLTTRALTGVILTVRPRSRIRDNVLWVHGDLEPFDGLLTGDTMPLLSGGVVRRGGGQVRTLIGPDGWLPDVTPGELIGLRWTGHALDVVTVDVPVPTDLTRVQSLLSRHSTSLNGTRYPLTQRYDPQPLTTVFLSTLREDPTLFATPWPPLSEIYPLPPRDVGDTSLWEAHNDGRRITLHLPHRVYDELSRRASLLGEDLADHAAVLLGAATDRVKVEVVSRYDRGYSSDYRGSSDYRDLATGYRDYPSEESIVAPLRSVPTY